MGAKIKAIRLSLGMTQDMFADKLNSILSESKISKGTVNNWEHNRNSPNKKRLKAIADLGGFTVEYLINNDSQSSDSSKEATQYHGIDSHFSERVSEKQKQLKISNQALADAVNTSVATIYRYKKTNFSNANLLVLFSICDYLNISPRHVYFDLGFDETNTEYMELRSLSDKLKSALNLLSLDQLKEVFDLVNVFSEQNSINISRNSRDNSSY